MLHKPTQHLSGSSDPFNCLSHLKITPQIQRLITFIREKYLATLYIPPMAMRMSGLKSFNVQNLNDQSVLGARQLQGDLDRALGLPRIAPGWLTCHLSGAMQMYPSIVNDDTKLILTHCRAESYRLLREDLASEEGLKATNIPLLIQIVYMFKAGLMENHPEDARVHAWALRMIAEIEDKQLAGTLFLQILHNDVEFSVQNMRPTLLDFSGWVRGKMGPCWAAAEQRLPDVGSGYQVVHPSVQSSVICDVVIRLRRILLMVAAEEARALGVKSPLESGAAYLIYSWGATRSNHDSGMMVNYYLAFLDESEFGNLEKAGSSYIEAALSLTALYAIRTYIQRAVINSIDMRDVSFVIMPRIKALLQTALQQMTDDEETRYQQALFWIYFSGAHYEESVRKELIHSGNPPTEDWFSHMLAASAHNLRVTKWWQALTILSGFVYDDVLRPDPDDWYETVVEQFTRPQPLYVGSK